MTRILKEVAQEYEVDYYEYTSLPGAIKSHCTILKRLGDPELLPQTPAPFAYQA